VASVLATSSSCTSSSSSKSLRIMILPSSGGPMTLRLRLLKSFLTNSLSRDVSRMRPSSSEDEDRSTTGTFSKGSPCSNIDEQGRREEISDGDPGGGGDPDSAGGGIEPPLSEEEPSLEGERERLFPFLSSIVAKRRRKENPKQGSEGMRDGYQHKTKGIFIARNHRGATVTGCHFDPRAPTHARHIENLASCASYLSRQANCPTFQKKRYTET
jgi:hypothetical protein